MQFDFSKVKEYKLYQALRWVAVLFCLRYKVTYIGRENIPQDGGFIIACNHQSGVDPIILGRGVKRTIHFMAKEELFENEALGIFIKHLNAFPVRRGQGDTTAVEFAEDIVRNGYVLGIFPEGTRSKENKVGRGKTGVALIAAKSGADVLPMGIIFEGEKLHFRSKLTLRIGKLIKSEELDIGDGDTKNLKKVKSVIMDSITELVEGAKQEEISADNAE